MDDFSNRPTVRPGRRSSESNDLQNRLYIIQSLPVGANFKKERPGSDNRERAALFFSKAEEIFEIVIIRPALFEPTSRFFPVYTAS